MLTIRAIPTVITVIAIILIAPAFAVLAYTPAAAARQDQDSTDQTTTPEPTTQLRPGDPATTLAGAPPMIYLHNPEGTLTPAADRNSRDFCRPVIATNHDDDGRQAYLSKRQVSRPRQILPQGTNLLSPR